MQKSEAQRTILMLECGDLQIKNEIQNGIIMMGLTKVGKTTCGHYLSQRTSIIGQQADGTKVYRIQGTTQYQNAKIGQKQDESQTQIPNFFYPTNLPQSTALIDFPGFNDSNGCFKMISNSYLHYRTFSKVKNIKFALVFDYKQYQDVAKQVSQTITGFLDGFDHFQQYKDNIFDATCIIMTKVPKTIDKETVNKRFNKINPRGFGNKKYEQIYKQFKQHIINKDKIFIFNEAEIGVQARNNDLILRINNSMIYWQRPKLKDKINMDGIRISASSLVKAGLQNSIFKAQWNQLQQAFIKQTKVFRQEMQTFLTLFVQQTFSKNDTQQSLKLIKQNVKSTVALEQKNNRIYRKYDNKRQKVRKQLFSPQNDNSATRTPIWLKKLKIAQLLSTISQNVAKDQNIYDFSALLKYSQAYLIIFKRYVQIYPRVQEVYKYFYKQYRILQSSKILYLILSGYAQGTLLKQFNFILSDYPHNIRQIFQSRYQTPYHQLKIKYCLSLDVSQNQDPAVQQQVQKFLQQTVIQIQNGFQYKQNNFDPSAHLQGIRKKKFNLQIQKINKKLNDILPKPNADLKEVSLILGQALLLRIQIQKKIQDSRLNLQRDQGCIILMLRLVNYIGDCLLKLQKFDLAKQCYASIANGFKVLQVYQKRSQKMRSPTKKQKLTFLFDYMKVAKKYQQLDLAIKLSQQAFYLSQILGQFQKVKICANFIKSITAKRRGFKIQIDDGSIQDYMTQIFDQFYYRPLSKKYLQDIQQMARYKMTPMSSPLKPKK